TQQDVFARREDGTGQWFIDSPDFQDWVSGSTSVVVDTLRNEFAHDASKGIAAVYCNFKEREMQSPQNLLAGACAQLIQNSIQPLPHALTSLHKLHRTSGTKPSLEEVNQIFDVVVRSHEPVRDVIIPRLKFLPDNVRVLITTRPIEGITGRFPNCPKIGIRATDADLSSPLVLFACLNFLAFTDCLRRVGRFLAAKLHVDSLACKTSVKALKKALERLSGTLDELYDDALQRIDSQSQDDKALAEKALCWVAYAYRSLSAPALQEAVAIDPDETDYDPEAIPAVSLILDVCAGLLIVDEEADVVRLVHYTAQDYFDGLAQSRYIDAHSSIAGECITYLDYDTFQRRERSYGASSFTDDTGLSVDEDAASNVDEDTLFSVGEVSTSKYDEQNGFVDAKFGNHLFRYASAFWAHHAKSRRLEPASALGTRIEEFLKSGPYILLITTENLDSFYDQRYPSFRCPGHGIAAFFGLCDHLRNLLHDVNNVDALLYDFYSWRLSALHLAAQNDQARAVQILLEHGADIECRDSFQSTPLSIAISAKALVAATLLVDKGADVMAVDGSNWTPITLIDWTSPIPFIKLLLNAGAIIREREIFRDNILMTSVIRNDDIETARWLFDHATLDSGMKAIQSRALVEAVNPLRMKMIEILLRNGADVNSKDVYGGTCLHAACASESPNQLTVIKYLIDHGAEINAREYRGRTALDLAVSSGHHEVVVALLHHGAGVDITHSWESTPLHVASARGMLAIAKELVKKNVGVDTRNSFTLTSLYSKSGKEEQGDFDPSDDIADVGHSKSLGAKLIAPQMARSSSWRAGRLRKLLLERDEFFEWRVWPQGMTALDIAVLRNDEDIIRLLKPLTKSTDETNVPTVDQYLCEVFQVSSFERVLDNLHHIWLPGKKEDKEGGKEEEDVEEDEEKGKGEEQQ
ncbi:MAG: hypothetical protein Q9224_005195, partial [Gallowayella concinna]